MHNYAIIEKKEAPTRSTFMLSFFEQMLFFFSFLPSGFSFFCSLKITVFDFPLEPYFMSGLYLEKNINCVGLNVNCGFFYFGIRCANVSVQTKKKQFVS